MLGDLGHLSVIITLVSVSACIYAYVYGGRLGGLEKQRWLNFARIAFGVHGLSVICCIGILYSIIYFHHYEYQYAWKHSSNDLPFYFIISCFWEGQEGSFLLWIFWNVLIGLVLLKTLKKWEFGVMTVFCTVQFFLVSMVVGAHIGSDFRIGSSPFLLLRDTVGGDVFKTNPDFVPSDGSGLNPLLQNIWMVIHPPIIFLGFALSSVPFSMALAALWQKSCHGFIQKSTAWLLVTLGVLGVGIIMGAYWAYETLNFGGYWNWDPVENAVLIPWLVLLAAAHGATLYRRKAKGLALTISLCIAGFILVVYSTFLTRSGILGDSSVHAFTDLGLSGQLLFFLVFIVFIALSLLVIRRNDLREVDTNTPVLSLEFWMITGISILCLSAFQILLPTSFPVINVIMESLGIDKNFAPPADQISFYGKFQIWFAITFCLIAVLGQTFYWRKIKSLASLESIMAFPLLASLLLTSLFVLLGHTSQISYVVLIFSANYLLIVSVQLLTALIRNTEQTSVGGLLAHVGMAVMLIGIVYSAGHKKVISKNLTINAPETKLPAHTTQENLLLSRNIVKENNGYQIVYSSSSAQTEDKSMVDRDILQPTFSDHEKILTREIVDRNGRRMKIGDTLRVNTENTYYNVELTTPDGDKFNLSPRMQNNPTMGFIASPDIKSYFLKDIYTHITNFPDPEKVKWNDPITKEVSIGEAFEVQGLKVTLRSIEVNDSPLGIPEMTGDVPLEALVSVQDQYANYEARPMFHIDKNRSVRLFPGEIKPLGCKIFLNKVDPILGRYELSVITSQRDWITIKSIEMPLISLVWLGSIILFFGVGVAAYYRIMETSQNSVPARIRWSEEKPACTSSWRLVVNRNRTV